ncbi:hypothetical protein [Ralstonia phage RSP15]|uniref:hypothetical protein n=1 Tax=Ralstonia phage RSP15 TaxID=1785960 RepID=UPI00074D45CB|nr:hypothetical protein BH754_gp205 [Ralstonia phage RSP15]BAU40101.1 hypothetical protein [Ralstonia phage RSP15]
MLKQVTFESSKGKVLEFKKHPNFPREMKNKQMVSHDQCGTMSFFVNLEGQLICQGCREVVPGVAVVFDGHIE